MNNNTKAGWLISDTYRETTYINIYKYCTHITLYQNTKNINIKIKHTDNIQQQ